MQQDYLYEGFKYTAKQLKKFMEAAGIFTISLRTNDIIHHTPDDPKAFREWLTVNGIEDIRPKG